MSRSFLKFIGNEERHGIQLKRLKIMNKDRILALMKILQIKEKRKTKYKR